ncbi:RelA/SpoT domain-containing protein [Cronobacter dublinensis]|uniref:RelA/SpoT domain-containing protein n=1 Tax=Cronobacter dublinensis TaxID=413497 RepID=UPI000CFC9AB3|nr:RelA/SpoT domain-containing protein [Cronobacter dublinensis]EKF2277827.1 RelA/SpoT domain-containing protein [Cronobacter dublinensis]EKF2291603.1 RelA/SpoT domain-containing protein [Cronobacter dublinensis]EKF2297231.1 RelA/SpoT domain-containing protein [Cronobacter dublinensis]EKK5269347.1 RelA/SpoT domain-containing protein [Cronobacter dublinensis]EKM0137850.1 RelA/SpoT domain-containing protein [Cronobacter dublinensis]
MTKPLSKSRIDKCGLALSKGTFKDEIDFIEYEDDFNEFRKNHLQPLSETTMELQRILNDFDGEYYIAQRLKRKPQILRKLKRFSVRLSQLQDIGGFRIIVHKNADVDSLILFIQERSQEQLDYNIERITDYREKGRDDTGYRAVHIIIKRNGFYLELQIRSRIQHYWAESIERTSVIYGYHLKEKEGAVEIINYFKELSNAFYELESGRQPGLAQKLAIDRLRTACEEIIKSSDKYKIFDSFVNVDVIKALKGAEGNSKQLNNWILVFDWNMGNFTSWDKVPMNPEGAVKKYVEYENMFPSENGFEVVLIGSSNVETVSKTHSHYFGIESYDVVLESFDTSIVGFSRKIDIDIGARQILSTLHRRHFWGKKTVTLDTIKNHFCKGVFSLEGSMQDLVDKELVINKNGVYSLNIQKKNIIEQYL